MIETQFFILWPIKLLESESCYLCGIEIIVGLHLLKVLHLTLQNNISQFLRNSHFFRIRLFQHYEIFCISVSKIASDETISTLAVHLSV